MPRGVRGRRCQNRRGIRWRPSPSPSRPLGSLRGAPCRPGGALPISPSSPPLFPGVGTSGGGRREAWRGCRRASGYVSAFLSLVRGAARFAGQQFGNMLAPMRRSGAAWTRTLLLQLLLAGPGGCLSRQELFPFGPGHGDLELEAGDDHVSPALELRRALRFFDRSDIDSVYVSATGAGGGGCRGGGCGGRAGVGRKAGAGGGARRAGRTWASWAGTGTRRPRGRGARRWVSRPKRAPRLRPARRRLCAAWPLSPEEHAGLESSPCLCGPARALPDPGNPGTRGPQHHGRSFLSAAGKSVRVSLLSCAFGDGTRSGRNHEWARSLSTAKARAGSQAVRGPWDFRRCRGRKRPPEPASAPPI